MGFSANPLSLSVPDSVLESCLQDSCSLDLLDHSTSPSAATEAKPPTTAIDDIGCFPSSWAQLVAVFSLLTINPLSSLTADDFAGETPPWTTSFFGDSDSYSFPSSSREARTRVHENVKRFSRNYATLFIVLFTCKLFEMPVALLGFVTSYAFWELFKFCVDRWESNRHHPVIRKILIRVALCATVSFLAFLNVQIAVFYALAISYSVVILHGGYRNDSPFPSSNLEAKIEKS
ncbi:hypothetical protein Bca52824_022085 [Brassica carinata]|uniref:PRA1 family protein n=1 Tax=Brassica carinata TaxID=52824 RepID=A0A8X7VG14_BRACI|nr:hypothetical protein Bca52824_022085 [Brassica carinata]